MRNTIADALRTVPRTGVAGQAKRLTLLEWYRNLDNLDENGCSLATLQERVLSHLAPPQIVAGGDGPDFAAAWQRVSGYVSLLWNRAHTSGKASAFLAGALVHDGLALNAHTASAYIDALIMVLFVAFVSADGLDRRSIEDMATRAPNDPSEARPVRVLYLGANSSSDEQLALAEEVRVIQQRLQRTLHQFEFISKQAVRPEHVQEALDEHQPHVVHVISHAGTRRSSLVGNDHKPHWVSGNALRMVLHAAAQRVRLLVLNAGETEALARAIRSVVDVAIGMRDKVADDAARIFAAQLYSKIGHGCSVRKAYDGAVAELLRHSHPDADKPIMVHCNEADPAEIFLVKHVEVRPRVSVSTSETSNQSTHSSLHVDAVGASTMSKAPVDVLLLCAKHDEYEQVRQVTDGLLDPGWVDGTGPRGWTVADGWFDTPRGEPLRIRTSWATHMGGTHAQAAAGMLIKHQPVRCLAMSGTCAGRRGEVSLGDVIFADRLWKYDAGILQVEDGAERFQGDMLQFKPPLAWALQMHQLKVPAGSSWLSDRPDPPLEHQEDWLLLQLLSGADPRNIAERKLACPDWTDVLPRLWKRRWLEGRRLNLTDRGRNRADELALVYIDGLPDPAPFRIHVAPIATGAAVTEDDGIFARLASSMYKVLGVETEASALGATAEIHGIPIAIAKGVSDHGDQFKDDRYRIFAARAAAECLIALLKRTAHLLPV